MLTGKQLILLFLTLFTASLSGCSHISTTPTLTSQQSAVQTILDSSGRNRTELEHFINKYSFDPKKSQAAQFLTSNLPPCDRATLSAELLEENLEYAFLARNSTPWGKDVPWTDFLHYVLPHRVSQEQAARWRKKFYNELITLVSNCRTMEEAVLTVNRWCFSKTGFKSTQRWDQNPLMTVNRGWGRCEEAVILTVCALRSVGIPARQAMVPAWQHSDDNHTWTEVLIDGKWHYIESANPDYGLDHAWFTGAARKAPLVLAYAYGNRTSTQDPVVSRPFGSTIINTTERYAPVSSLKIQLQDKNGFSLPDAKVLFSIFNYGSFRPVAAKKTDQHGRTEILLGPGSVLVSAAVNGTSAFAGSSWIPGDQEKRESMVLTLIPDNTPEGIYSFRFAFADSSAAKAPAKNAEGTRKSEFDAIKKSRLAKFEAMYNASQTFAPKAGTQIAKAGLNAPAIMTAIESCPPEYNTAMLKSINKMLTADLVKISDSDLISNSELSVKARREAAGAGLKYKDNIFEEFVLNPRIMYEQLRNWRKLLYAEFNIDKDKNIENIIKHIGMITEELTEVKRGTFGSSIDPLGVFQSGTFSNVAEKGTFAVAAMRSAGIPSRYLNEQGWAEYFNGDKWVPFYPEFPDESGNRNATEASAAYYSEWNRTSFVLPGFPAGTKPARYFKDFTVSKLNKTGFFTAIEKTIGGRYDTKTGKWEIKVPDCSFYIISATRNNENEPEISVRLLPTSKQQDSK